MDDCIVLTMEDLLLGIFKLMQVPNNAFKTVTFRAYCLRLRPAMTVQVVSVSLDYIALLLLYSCFKSIAPKKNNCSYSHDHAVVCKPGALEAKPTYIEMF